MPVTRITNNSLATGVALSNLNAGANITFTKQVVIPSLGASAAFGSGVITALATVANSGGGFVTANGAATLTNKTINGANNTITNVAISTGVSGLGANVATFLATPTSANLAAAVSDETGSGALVFANSPTITTPTIEGAAVFSSTTNRPTSAGNPTLSANSLITRGDYDQLLQFRTPYVSPILLGGSSSGNASLFRHVIQQLYMLVEFAPTPIAGVSSGWLVQPHFPIIASHGSSSVNIPGTSSVVLFDKPYTLSAMIELGRNSTVTSDVLARFGFGNAQVTSNRLQGIGNEYGWGVRIWRNSSILWNIALYARFLGVSGGITALTNATPIVVTTNPAHLLTNGEMVEITNAGGNTAANGIWTVANVTSTTFELVGSVGNGAYTSGAIVNKITAPATIPVAVFQRILVTHNGSGQLTLRLGSMEANPLLTLNGMTGRSATGQLFGGFFCGMQSVTSVEPYFSFGLHEPRIYQNL